MERVYVRPAGNDWDSFSILPSKMLTRLTIFAAVMIVVHSRVVDYGYYPEEPALAARMSPYGCSAYGCSRPLYDVPPYRARLVPYQAEFRTAFDGSKCPTGMARPAGSNRCIRKH
ncbi:unnamed protein product [Leptosia nina]|uniref:Uncharacterized protein n=1 Tax=Leptosia nina TaxID=320188 RepID=A0AAV1J5J3_9NEOP